MKSNFMFRERKPNKYECYIYGSPYPSIVLNSKDAAEKWVELFRQWDKLKSVYFKLCKTIGIDDEIFDELVRTALRKKITAEQFAEQMKDFALQSLQLLESAEMVYDEISEHEKTNKAK